MKIYVASSWRNAFQPEVVNILKDLGHEVYDFRHPNENNDGFSWSEIDPDWENWTSQEYVQALKHPIADRGFNFDFDAMKWADCCVMVLPCGRSANTEAGWMKGAGKKVFVFQPINQEPELMYKIYDGILTTYESLKDEFSNTCHIECISCNEEFDIYAMETDDSDNHYCAECWAELSPIMKADYDERVKNGEIDEE